MLSMSVGPLSRSYSATWCAVHRVGLRWQPGNAQCRSLAMSARHCCGVAERTFGDLDPVSWTRGFVRFIAGGLVASVHGTRLVCGDRGRPDGVAGCRTPR
jgi:hypothetical protein